ncbi:universal stress protein [Desulfuromonas versatilis]|uniref:Universal stress protein n=1 Tax=Desulfuromonas versatilis TaxID=2802975 RepID=A0ABM8HQW5_9BACT|nr:universal stress protein [Desulfuromonas versatilis]BCR05444.1 universal stress protein [Desulfuromonas versatilis]
MQKPLKIIVPIDFSSYSIETLEFAFGLRKLFPATWVLHHVVASGEVESFANLGGEPLEIRKRRISEAEAGLKKEAERRRAEHPGIHIECRVTAGIPFKEICRLADEENAGLIVIGTHGRTGLSHLLIGSTAERVVQHASCPVLSIKPRIL